jgi:hypothetical protein
MVKRVLAASTMALAGAALALGLSTAPAAARVFVGIGIGVPVYAPPPVVVAPPPVYYAPPPVVVAPAPTYVPTYVQQPSASNTWYYCDNPQGYYPTVQTCSSGWRPVAAH